MLNMHFTKSSQRSTHR